MASTFPELVITDSTSLSFGGKASPPQNSHSIKARSQVAGCGLLVQSCTRTPIDRTSFPSWVGANYFMRGLTSAGQVCCMALFDVEHRYFIFFRIYRGGDEMKNGDVLLFQDPLTEFVPHNHQHTDRNNSDSKSILTSMHALTRSLKLTLTPSIAHLLTLSL